MDAEHRHELKTNELANWLGQLPEWTKKNSNMIIGLGLILIGLLTWPLLSRMAKDKDLSNQTQTTNAIQKLENDVIRIATDKTSDAPAKQQALSMLLVDADLLIAEADKLDAPDLAAMARIKAAQAIRTELQLRPEEVPAETVETQIKKAQDAYQKAFDQAQTPQVKAMAQLGLGLCTEELGQTQQAAEIYNQIIKNEQYAATVIPAQAQERLNFLDENIGKVYFAPAPAAPETPEAPAAVAPESGPALDAAPAPVIPAAPQVQQTPAPAPAPAPEQSAAPAPAEQPAAPAPAEAPAAPAEQNP